MKAATEGKNYVVFLCNCFSVISKYTTQIFFLCANLKKKRFSADLFTLTKEILTKNFIFCTAGSVVKVLFLNVSYFQILLNYLHGLIIIGFNILCKICAHMGQDIQE